MLTEIFFISTKYISGGLFLKSLFINIPPTCNFSRLSSSAFWYKREYRINSCGIDCTFVGLQFEVRFHLSPFPQQALLPLSICCTYFLLIVSILLGSTLILLSSLWVYRLGLYQKPYRNHWNRCIHFYCILYFSVTVLWQKIMLIFFIILL